MPLSGCRSEIVEVFGVVLNASKAGIYVEKHSFCARRIQNFFAAQISVACKDLVTLSRGCGELLTERVIDIVIRKTLERLL